MIFLDISSQFPQFWCFSCWAVLGSITNNGYNLNGNGKKFVKFMQWDYWNGMFIYVYTIPPHFVSWFDLSILSEKNVTTNQMNFKLDLGQGQQMVLDQAVWPRTLTMLLLTRARVQVIWWKVLLPLRTRD